MSDLFAPIDPGDPTAFPVGTRVTIETDAEDMHFFRRGQPGTVVRLTGRPYLGVIVELDDPYLCDHGIHRHEVREFNFSPRNLGRVGVLDEAVRKR